MGRQAAELGARLRRNRPALLGAVILGALALLAVVGPLVTPDPDASDFSLARDRYGAPPGPSLAHWLGTDPLYRDELARLASGARVSLATAIAATLMTTVLGATVGIAAGSFAGGRLRVVDALLMRLVDVLLALPFLLFVTAVGVAIGRADVGTILLILGLTGWAGTARLLRAKTMQVRALDFVTAARALGAGPLWIVRRHVLPNVASTLVVVATSSVGPMILAEAVLSYLTVGVQPPRATWGRMLHEAEPYLGTRLGLVAIPGFAILLSVLGWNRLGDGLRDALDPRGDGARTPGSRARLPVDLCLAAAALLLVSLAAPAHVLPPVGREPAVDRPARGGVLHLARHVHLRTLDPALVRDGSGAVLDLLFPRLVTWDPAGRLVPELARSVTVSDDGRTYTFGLREGVRFHDGMELLAADVKRSLERALRHETACPGASHYAMIAGFEAFHAGRAPALEGVRVLGEHALAVDLDRPDATFLPVMTLPFAAPVCRSAGASASARNPAAPCGAGPFRLVSWDPDAGLRLARNEAYYRPGRPYLDGIDWATGVRATTQRYKFEDGELDYLHDFSAADGALYRADPAWRGHGRWVDRPETRAVFLNTELPPFDNRWLRRAVAFALDPSVLSKVNPSLTPADRVLPPGIPGPDRSEPMRRHDPAAALDAMAAAGFPFDPATGEGGYPRDIEYLAMPDTFEQAAGEVFQQQLARVGLRVRLRLVSWATFQAESSRRRRTAMGACGWVADFPDPANFFESTLSSAAIQDEGSQNLAFFSDPAFDALLAEAHAETDPARRRLAYARAEATVRDEAPWVPTYSARAFEVWQPYVRGYLPHAVLEQQFADVWLDRSGQRDGSAASGLPGQRDGKAAFGPWPGGPGGPDRPGGR